MAQKFVGETKKDKYAREAIRIIIKEAKNGNPESQYLIGMHYLVGVSIEKDSKKGWQWLKKSMEGGYAKAYEVFGDTEEDDKLAVMYYKRAIEKAKSTDRYPINEDEINKKILYIKSRNK